MIAPEPVLEERGTPFSVFYRCRALSDLGYQIDLVTYPIGRDFEIKNLRILRAPKIPFINKVKIGPSLVKIPLDFMLFLKALLCLIKNSYDFIHVHEEAGIFGSIFSRIFKVPYLYDMHSSLPQQLENFEFTNSRILHALMSWLEKAMVKNAKAVIVICPDLGDAVKNIDSKKKYFLIENMPIAFDISVDEEKAKAIRSSLAKENEKILLYTGTFESYQGMDLLVESIPLVVLREPKVRYVFIGGKEHQINTIKTIASGLGVDKYVDFLGKLAPEEMPAYMQAADILLSPRSKGTNTPLKIYSYLHAGKPILATNKKTHTQVLNSDVALLVEPNKEAFAQGTIGLLEDDELSRRIAKGAKGLAMSKYSYSKFLDKTREVYSFMGT